MLVLPEAEVLTSEPEPEASGVLTSEPEEDWLPWLEEMLLLSELWLLFAPLLEPQPASRETERVAARSRA